MGGTGVQFEKVEWACWRSPSVAELSSDVRLGLDGWVNYLV